MNIFHLLSHGRPITKFESLKDLYLPLNVKNNPRKHWTNSSGWKMAKFIHEVVLQNMKTIVQDCTFFALNADEVMTIDN